MPQSNSSSKNMALNALLSRLIAIESVHGVQSVDDENTLSKRKRYTSNIRKTANHNQDHSGACKKRDAPF